MQTTLTVDGLNDLLAVWRTAAKIPSTAVLAEKANEYLPDAYHFTGETMRRYEVGKSTPDPLRLAAIVVALGHRVKELPEPHRSNAAPLEKAVRSGSR